MNITFLIGNGFDIKLGLKTRYTDFYNIYIDSNKDRNIDDNIKCFSELIEDNYETWADFEMAFAENAFGTKYDIRDILEDFSKKFAEYLSEQTRICNYTEQGISEQFRNFLINGYRLLEARDKRQISNIYNSLTESIFINFVNFNYTDTLDNLIKTYKETTSNSNILREFSSNNVKYVEAIDKTLNIHGTLNNSIIIGIDSIEQFKNENLKKDNSISKYCIKSAVNEYIGNEKAENDFVSLISSSRIIYAYGLSFGKSDKSRWDIITQWLKYDNRHKLIIYKYQTGFENYKSVYKPRLLDAIEELKDYYLELLGFDKSEYESYYDQIFVIDSDDVLDFKLIHDETIDEQEESLEVCTA
jgi:hypothetical protein